MIESEGFMVTLITFFFAGILSSLSPCTLPTLIFITSYVKKKKEHSKLNKFTIGAAFSAGMIIVITFMGLVAGRIGSSITDNPMMDYIVAGVFIFTALWMMEIIDIDLSFKSIKGKRKGGIWEAFILGMPFGVAASPCTIPLTMAVLAYSLKWGSTILGGILMFSYSMGKCFPLVSVGIFSGSYLKLEKIAKHKEIIDKICGTVLIVLAFYYIWKA